MRELPKYVKGKTVGVLKVKVVRGFIDESENLGNVNRLMLVDAFDGFTIIDFQLFSSVSEATRGLATRGWKTLNTGE